MARWEVVFGYTGAFVLLSLVQAISIITVANLVFRVPIRGSLLLAVLATTLVGIVALGFGILISGIARTEFQAVQSIFLFTFPMLFLSGVFAPAETIPSFLRPLLKVIPLSYAVTALRDILNHGRGLAAVAPDLIILAIFAFAFLAAATFSFGRRA